MKTKGNTRDVDIFLQQSNCIEREYSQVAFDDAQSAWAYAIQHRDKITVDYILKVHKEALQRLRPDIAGRVRGCRVKIGGVVKPFISRALIKSDLKKWCEEHNKPNMTKAEIKQSHISFQFIHPFEDGNGRTGRIIMNIQRINNNYTILIIHGMSEFDLEIHPEQRKYYTWFK